MYSCWLVCPAYTAGQTEEGTEYTTFNIFVGFIGSFNFMRCCFRVEHADGVVQMSARARTCLWPT